MLAASSRTEPHVMNLILLNRIEDGGTNCVSFIRSFPHNERNELRTTLTVGVWTMPSHCWMFHSIVLFGERRVVMEMDM